MSSQPPNYPPMQQPPSDYPQSPYPNYQQQFPPKRPSEIAQFIALVRRRPIILIPIAVVALIVLVTAITATMQSIGGTQQANATATANAQQTACCAAPTDVPTRASLATATPTTSSIPTPKPTQQLQGTPGDAVLGSDIGPFITKFGQPVVISPGAYDFQNHLISIVIQNHHSFSILDNADNNIAWSESEAKAICLALSPADATYLRRMTILDPSGQPQAIQYVYYSPSLAKEFPTSDFTDEHANPAKPGTFGIVISYTLGSTSQFDSCSTEVGLQSI